MGGCRSVEAVLVVVQAESVVGAHWSGLMHDQVGWDFGIAANSLTG